MGELLDMAEAKERAEWARTSETIAAIVNTVSRRPVRGSDIDPFRAADAKRRNRVTPADLAALWGIKPRAPEPRPPDGP